jgi:hypothetical protein
VCTIPGGGTAVRRRGPPFGGGAAHLSLSIKALEFESAVIAKKFVHTDDAKHDVVVVEIPLNSWALTSRTLHLVSA